MANEYQWKVSGLYFEACNCESVCPCYSGQAPSHGYCEGPCVWHIQSGHFKGVPLDGLNVLLIQRCEGRMRDTMWRCRFYLDDRATDAQFQGLQHIFTAANDGHLANIFRNLWDVQSVERAPLDVRIEGWQHRASLLGRLGVTIGILKPEAGPTLCRVPNVSGVAALASENWFEGTEFRFSYPDKNALSTTFEYHSDQ